MSVPNQPQVREFLEREIDLAAENVEQLKTLCKFLMEGFRGIYTAISEKFVDSDSSLPLFVQHLERVVEGTPAHKGVLPRQKHSDIVQLYLASHRTIPMFYLFMKNLEQRSEALPGSGVGPLKTMFVLISMLMLMPMPMPMPMPTPMSMPMPMPMPMPTRMPFVWSEPSKLEIFQFGTHVYEWFYQFPNGRFCWEVYWKFAWQLVV